MVYPWISLSHWAPFRIDALGLVTLLGAEEVDTSIGRLVSSRWLDYMPLLGAFVIASDRFREKKHNIRLYNISSGIYTTDLSFWFTRWLLCQDFATTRSVVVWDCMSEPREWWWWSCVSATISFCLVGFLMSMTVLSRDWYGFANAVVVAVSVMVRAYVVGANRKAIDRNVCRSLQKASGSQGTGQETKAPIEATEPQQMDSGHAKILVIMPDSKAVTMYIPGEMIVPIFSRNPKVMNRASYHLARWIGWLAFVVHIISIGMAQLNSQIYTVVLIVLPTVLICHGFGCDDSKLYRGWMAYAHEDEYDPYTCWIGSYIRATVFQWPVDVEFEKNTETKKWRRRTSDDKQPLDERSERRQDLYAWLDLTTEEEASMAKWDLLPHVRQDDNTWAKDYNEKKSLVAQHPVDIGGVKDRALAAVLGRGKGKVEDVENGHEDQTHSAAQMRSQGPRRTDTTLSSSGMTASSTVNT